MSILLQGELIRQEIYVQTWKDLLYNSLMQIIYDHPRMKTLSDKAWFQEERGKECKELWMEIFMWQVLIDHLINLRDSILHLECPTLEQINQLKEDFEINCIRNTFLCSCKDMSLFDKLLQKTNLSIDGWDNMVEELPDDEDCENPWIIP